MPVTHGSLAPALLLAWAQPADGPGRLSSVSPVCTRSLLGRSFLLLSTYYFIACFPPASPTPRNAPLHKSFLVLLLRASGALLPAWLVPKSRFHHQQQPVSKASYSKWAVLGYPSFGVPSWATVETDPLTRRALRQASL